MDQLQVQTGNERLKRLMLSLAKPEKWKATEELAAASLRAYAADERLARVDTVIIIGHGTSLATAMNAEFLFSRAAGAAARAVPAYQFRSYARDYLKRPERTLVVGISCSGNTESVVKGLEAARQAGALAMGITGRGETKMREISDYLIEADTAVEQEAGMTAYSASHLFLLYSALRAAVLLGEKRGNAKGLKYWEAQWKSVKNAMSALPELFEKMGGLAEDYSQEEMNNVVALGTGPNLGTAQEGALKICEFAWVFGACEELEDFAHGRFREADGKIPLLLLAPHENLQEKVLDLLAGCEIARTPTVIFTQKALPEVQKLADRVILMPAVEEECLTPFLYVFPLWFLGYHFRSRQGKLVGERRFGLKATDISYQAYLSRRQT